MSAPGRWSDLAARMGSGLVMVLVGLAAVAAGGDVFHVFVALICGAMIWELVRMLAPDQTGPALWLGALVAAAMLLAIYLPPAFALPVLLAPAFVGFSQIEDNRAPFMIFSVGILLAGYGMMSVRDEFGFVWMLWLVLVVVATDVAGYFAGKSLGGRKFWPRVSPNKTWSGTIAGWLAAAAVGLVFALWQGTSLGLVAVSVAMSMAAQMGDISESAIKRRVGVKDASALIPGHGGLLDRFDGMLGAAIFVLITAPLTGYPPGLV